MLSLVSWTSWAKKDLCYNDAAAINFHFTAQEISTDDLLCFPVGVKRRNKMGSKARHGSCFHGAYSLTGKMVNNNICPWCCETLQIGEAGFLSLGDFCLRKCRWS